MRHDPLKGFGGQSPTLRHLGHQFGPLGSTESAQAERDLVFVEDGGVLLEPQSRQPGENAGHRRTSGAGKSTG